MPILSIFGLHASVQSFLFGSVWKTVDAALFMVNSFRKKYCFFVSIHAPVRVRRFCFHRYGVVSCVSIHAQDRNTTFVSTNENAQAAPCGLSFFKSFFPNGIDFGKNDSTFSFNFEFESNFSKYEISDFSRIDFKLLPLPSCQSGSPA